MRLNRSPSIYLGVACALLFLALPLAAQEDPESSRQRTRIAPSQTVGYTLEHIDANHALRTIKGLLEEKARMVPDSRTGTLLVVAPESAHRRIRELLEMIDVPSSEPPGENHVTRIFTLKHRSVKSVRPTAEMHDLNITSIEATNSLIARGTISELRTLEEVIVALDVETANIQFECWILEHGVGTRVADHVELSSLERELAKTGLAGYGVLSHTTIRGVSGEKFTSSQGFSGRRIQSLELRGTAHVNEGASARLAIQLQANVGLAAESESRTGGNSGSFMLSTELKTQVGKLVVVGLAPTGDEDSKPFVLVMRIQR